MATKKQAELPEIKGPGVEPLEIPEIDKAIANYEKKKAARCAESPGEIDAKKKLKATLHAHRDELPRNQEGIPFYRHDEKDYLLEEKLKVRKVGGDEDDD